MHQHPIPVVICSSLTGKGSASAIQALEYGAVEVIHKPSIGAKDFLNESRTQLLDRIRAAAKAQLTRKAAAPLTPQPKLSADVVLSPQTSRAMHETTDQVIAIGASTGGTEAIRQLLMELPMDHPGVVIVQHMPEKFTASFAERLNQLCAMTVREAKNGDRVLRGQVLIAPGNHHTLLKRSGAQYHVEVKGGPLVNRHRPSVDVLFRSTARYAGSNAIGVILTGMGDDGAKGLKEMKEAGAFTMAQDESSCVVFGMPKEAIRLGGVDRTLPLEEITQTLIRKAR